jgi:hypothetical protein
VKVNSQQTRKIEKCAQKILQLCDGEPLPPLTISGNGDWQSNDRNVIANIENQAPVKRAYYDRVKAILGDDADDWLFIKHSFRDIYPAFLDELKDLRNEILDHTDLTGKNICWLEAQDGYLNPNKNLRSKIMRLADELQQKIKAEVEQETTKAMAFLETMPGRLKELLSTTQRKARYEEAQKQINDDCGDYTKWEIKRDPYKLKDQEEAEEVYQREMPRYVRWAREYYNWHPLEPGTAITEPLNRREKVLAACFAIERIVNVVRLPDTDEKFNRDREQFQRDFECDDDNAGVFRIKKGYAERLKTKYEEALNIIEEDLTRSEQEANSVDSMPYDNRSKANRIREVARTLEEVREHEPDSVEIRDAAKKAEKVLLDNWDLIRRFPLEHYLDSTLRIEFERLQEFVVQKDRHYMQIWGNLMYFIKPTETGKSIMGELEAWASTLQQGETEGKEQLWDKNNTDYMGTTEAARIAKDKGRKISVVTLGRRLIPEGQLRYMRSYNSEGKPTRSRVHRGDFMQYIKTLPILRDEFSEDAFDERQSMIKAEKKTQGKLPDINNGYNKLAKKIYKQ